LQTIQRATSQAASAATGLPTRSLITPFKPYSFDPAALEAVHAQGSLMPPFAVMGSQTVLGPEESSQGPVGQPYRRYLWGTALPMDRDHSDLIILKSLLFGHQNEALSQLFDDSWARAHAFYKSYEQLKRAQLEAKVAAGQMSGSVGAILNVMEGLDVDMSPLLAEVCSSISNFGGGEQLQLQDRLRCEEQHRLEHRLRQAQGELKQTRQSSISIQKFRLVVAVAVMLAFVVGAGSPLVWLVSSSVWVLVEIHRAHVLHQVVSLQLQPSLPLEPS
jgi:septin family protein